MGRKSHTWAPLSKYKFVKKQRKRVHKVDKNIKKCSDPLSFIRFRLHVFLQNAVTDPYKAFSE